MTLSQAAFNRSPEFSLKVTSYFDVYDRLLDPFRARVEPVTLVEFGVLHGGSLHMWREILGAEARIIGIDLNPDAERHRRAGFEIVVCDQENYASLLKTFAALGPVDIIIDDGAHTNPACVNTLLAGFQFIKPGGIHVVEDLHTSFNRTFGNPHKTSVFSLAIELVRRMSLEYGHPEFLEQNVSDLDKLQMGLRAVEFYQSILVFRFRDHSDPWLQPRTVTNGKAYREDVVDQRNDKVKLLRLHRAFEEFMLQSPAALKALARRPGLWIQSFSRDAIILASARRRNRQLQSELRARFHWWGRGGL